LGKMQNRGEGLIERRAPWGEELTQQKLGKKKNGKRETILGETGKE